MPEDSRMAIDEAPRTPNWETEAKGWVRLSKIPDRRNESDRLSEIADTFQCSTGYRSANVPAASSSSIRVDCVRSLIRVGMPETEFESCRLPSQGTSAGVLQHSVLTIHRDSE